MIYSRSFFTEFQFTEIKDTYSLLHNYEVLKFNEECTWLEVDYLTFTWVYLLQVFEAYIDEEVDADPDYSWDEYLTPEEKVPTLALTCSYSTFLY